MIDNTSETFTVADFLQTQMSMTNDIRKTINESTQETWADNASKALSKYGDELAEYVASMEFATL